MPGPLFAVTIQKASKSKISGALIALGHGIVEIPLIFVIFFLLNKFEIPAVFQVLVGLIGGTFMGFMGVHTFHNRHKQQITAVSPKLDSVLAGVYTSIGNAGFILWWLTIGTTLILNAKIFGLLGFSVFAGVHWLTDFVWYAVTAFAIFKSQKFWNEHVKTVITLFSATVFIGFGLYFIVSALWTLFA